MEDALANFLGFGVPLLGAIIVAILAYWREQKIKRIEQRQRHEEELRRHKQELYSKIKLSVFNLWSAKSSAARDVEALCNISDSWVFASDDVLRQINLFMQTYDDSRNKHERAPKRNERLQPIVAKLFLLMRQDLFSTKLTAKEAEKSVRFYRWVGKPIDSERTSKGK